MALPDQKQQEKQMSNPSPPTKNGRERRQEDDKKFLYMVIFTLVILGGGLIGLIYGWLAILSALPFLLGGALLILLPWLLLTAYGKWRERMEEY